MRYLFILTALLFFTSCGENSENIENNNHIEITDSVIDEINKEISVLSIIKDDNVHYEISKNKPFNMKINIQNIRSENVFILIPETADNKNKYVTFRHNNLNNNQCSALSLCNVDLSMIIGEQSNIKGNFTIFLPVTLLNKQEFDKFIKLNQEEKYKAAAMKYLHHRIYLLYKINGSIK